MDRHYIRANLTSRTRTRALALMLVLMMALPIMPAGLAGGSTDGGLVDDLPSNFKVGESTENSATASNGQRKVVRSDNGTLHAVWESADEVYYAFSTDGGVNWSDPVNLTRNDVDDSAPAIATNGTNLYVVWRTVSGSNAYLRFRGYYGAGDVWDPALDENPYTISSGWNRHYLRPSIVSQGDYVYIASGYSSGSDHEITSYTNNNNGQGGWNGQWVTFDNIDQRNPSISAAGPALVIAYEDNQGGDWEVKVIASPDRGQNWGGDTALSNNGAPSVNPCIVVNGTRAFVAWQDRENGTWDIHYRYTPDPVHGWVPPLAQPPLNLTAGTSDSRSPSLVHEENVTYLFYMDDRDGAGNDVILRVNSTGNWSRPLDLTRSRDDLRAVNAFLNITARKLDYVYTRSNGTTGPHDVLYGFHTLDNEAPELDWTGETGYVGDGLDPEGNTTGHTYTYRVEYTDADDHPPMDGYPLVLVDRNMDGSYDHDEMYSMEEVRPSDTDHTDGKLYTFDTVFTHIGNYTYRFMAKDSANAWADGDPTRNMDGPVIDALNVRPRLDWTEEMGYEFDGLEPESGNVGENFTYRIRYFDDHDEAPAPGFPVVQFDINQDGDFDDPEDEEAVMEEAAAADTSYDNGKTYFYVRTFDTNGTFGYRFVARDLIGLENISETRSGPEVSIPTEIPMLHFHDSPGYRTDGVDPDRGSVHTEFTFLVNYSDADNEPPRDGAVGIGIDLDGNGSYEDDEWTLMEPVDPADENYTDNKTYQHIRGFDLGTYNYTFRAWDTMGAAALGDPTGNMEVVVDIDNEPPVLKWTNEENYTSAGVSPDNGTTNLTEFVYRVRYEDGDGDLPVQGHPEVGVDLDLDGTIEIDEYFTMDGVSSADTDVTDGKLYSHSRTLSRMGNYTYTFRARDSYAWATGTPSGVHQGPVIEEEFVPSSPPVLSWVNVTGFTDDGAHPDSGLTSDTFDFSIEYTDADNDTPMEGQPLLLLDMDGDGGFDGTDDRTMEMYEEDMDDRDFTDGKVYVRSLVFETTGVINYTFESMSSRSGEDGFPRNILSGSVNVTGQNLAPVLNWTGWEGYMEDGVEPDVGEPGEDFEYRVSYRDADNDPPASGYPRVLIDLDGNGDLDPDTEAFEMMEMEEGDQDFTDGKVYHYFGVNFDEEGTYSYRFEVNDLQGAWAEALEADGPVIEIPVTNDPPVLSFPDMAHYRFDGVDPSVGTPNDTFIFMVVYTDVDGDMPVEGYPRLIIDPDGNGRPDSGSEVLIMEEEDPADTDVMDGKVYTLSTTLEEGEHTYSFDVENAMNQTALAGPLDGPVVTEDAGGGGDGTDTEDQGLSDMLWILVLLVLAVICLVVGYLAGRGRGKDEEPGADISATEPGERAAAPLTTLDIEESEEEGVVPEDEEIPAGSEEEGVEDEEGGGSDE